jgi:hypothetical protein
MPLLQLAAEGEDLSGGASTAVCRFIDQGASNFGGLPAGLELNRFRKG